MSSPTTEHLRGIWGASSTAIWAVGDAGTVLFYDGSDWTQTTIPTARNLRAVWGFAADDVWVAGNGAIFHWDGAAWTEYDGACGLVAIWGASSNDVWAAGYSCAMRWTGAGWNNVPGVMGHTVFSTSADDVWVIKTQKEAYHFDGLEWTSRALDTGGGWNNDIYTLRGDAAGGLIAAGKYGVMYRLTPSGWRRLTRGQLALLPERLYVSTLTAAAGGVVYAGGYEDGGLGSMDAGYLMRRTDQGWVKEHGVSQAVTIADVSASSASSVWAVNGFRSDVYWNDGYGWQSTDALNNADLEEVFALSYSDVWAVGDDETHHWDGEAWSVVPNPISSTDVDLRAVGGSDTDDVWAGGSNGTMLHWNGTAWSSVASGTTNYIYEISAPASDFAVASATPLALIWDGVSWSETVVSEDWALRSVWSPAPGEAWAVAGDGSLHRWDGTAWSPADGPGGLMAVSGWGPDTWVVRSNGSVLHRSQ
jgi:hypothetical protein